MTKDIVQIPLSQLTGLLQTDLQDLTDILQQDGCLAVTELPRQYGLALARLQSSAPECLRRAASPQFILPDGSLRRTLARDSQQQSSLVPDCLEEEYDVIQRHFDMAGQDFTLLHLQIQRREIRGQRKERKFKVRLSRLIVL